MDKPIENVCEYCQKSWKLLDKRNDGRTTIPGHIRKLLDDVDHWKSKFIQQNKDLGCEQMDPNGTIWDHAKRLQDENKRLAEALENVKSNIGSVAMVCPSCHANAPEPSTSPYYTAWVGCPVCGGCGVIARGEK